MTLRIKTRTLILESQRFKVERVSYALGGSQVFSKDIISHPGAVVILPVDIDGRILFVRQARLALDQETLELPAGTLNNAEDPLIAAKRELAEEVGVKAAIWQSLGFIYSAPGICDEKLYLFVAKDLSPYKLEPDAEERITIESYSLAEVVEMIQSGRLNDAKSISALYRAQLASKC